MRSRQFDLSIQRVIFAGRRSNMERLVYKYFSDDDFLRISGKIAEAEKTTSGEIRIAIKEKKHFLEWNKSIRLLAEKEFFKLGMDKTRDRTGILLYLLLRDRQFYILADSGIHELVGDAAWNRIRDEMQHKFAAGKFREGILWGIEHVGLVLTKHFPVKPDDTNEISNEVVIE
jgi:uncharacterized membrane protein